MRFSIFLNARSVAPEQDRYVMTSLIDHTVLADQLGFEAVFNPDHHFTGYAPWASDPMMFAAYLTARVPNMYLGFSVTSVPLHSPVRFVERINILDQLTEGKVLIGVGSGTTPEEMIGFGVNYKEASALSDSNLEIAEQLWAKAPEDAPVKFSNSHYSGEVLQRIAPAPYTKGHARLMPVAFKEASVQRAATHGWPAFIPAFSPPIINNLEPLKHVTKHFTKYKDLLLAAGHSDAVTKDALSWTTHTYQCVHLAETDEQAREELEIILRAYQDAVDREAAFAAKAEGKEENKKADINTTALSDEWIATWCLYGSPETVIKHLQPYADLGIGNILCGTTTGPLNEERLKFANQTIRLMAEKVIPHFAAKQKVAA
jgi:alkanesulfonate monooxygenase SsuD/methylene tetrahydromethanopterin reductase-like flavin-dependent oxidoreductase (luciferase family)